MAEAEDVIVDVARHATIFVRDLWQRHRGNETQGIDVPQLLQRLDLVIAGVFGSSRQLRIAQHPAPMPLVRRMFRSYERPCARDAIPATDGCSIWLPAPLPGRDAELSIAELRIMSLQQAARAHRGSAHRLHGICDPLERAIYEVLEADAADIHLLSRLHGLRDPVNAFRARALSLRPALAEFPAPRRGLERWVREIMEVPSEPASIDVESTPQSSMRRARELAAQLLAATADGRTHIVGLLYRDSWTAQLRVPPRPGGDDEASNASDAGSASAGDKPPRSARLTRRPEVREADERDERTGPGAWMIQTAQPQEHAEDPLGMQRPTDREAGAAAEEFADSVSELMQARLVSTPGAPKEVLLSDDPPDVRQKRAALPPAQTAHVLMYPEWDWRARTYRQRGAAVHLLAAQPGQREWVQKTLDEHRAMLGAIRRQFESLRAERVRLRQQPDGEEIDIEACVDGFADARAGSVLPTGLYQTTRAASRELAVLLLIDVSGSTDGWVSNRRRVIDVEREALLLVCLALESLGEPYGIIAFSGEGPGGVTVRSVKGFPERYGDEVALRIAGLEPEKYTRAGAALRHASALLMGQPARQRLLLVLSDGKPNDLDEYEGRYGLEDMRQAVIEARLQGIFPFCLTVDRHTANYLPAVFGEHQYAVLHRPELLPTAMVGWLRRLVRG